MQTSNHLAVVLFLTLTTAGAARGVEVYEGLFPKATPSDLDTVLVRLSASEVRDACASIAASERMGMTVATQVVRFAGMPDAWTAKVAAVPTWAVLSRKYAADIWVIACKTKAGNELTLRYTVDLVGVRRVFAAATVGDLAPQPGGKATQLAVEGLNLLLNASRR